MVGLTLPEVQLHMSGVDGFTTDLVTPWYQIDAMIQLVTRSTGTKSLRRPGMRRVRNNPLPTATTIPGVNGCCFYHICTLFFQKRRIYTVVIKKCTLILDDIQL